MAQYQGHRSWNAWNVSLWINNDEGLYHEAQECFEKARDRCNITSVAQRMAARHLLRRLNDSGIYKTPDGGVYNKTCIYEAMEGMLD